MNAATCKLQQRLPLAVLKLKMAVLQHRLNKRVATALTACGIETITS